MRRGEIWTVADRGDYTGKPRPVVIVQDETFEHTDSVVVCPCTTTPVDADWLRVQVDGGRRSGLQRASWVMVDKITSVRRERVRSFVGQLDAEEWSELAEALMIFLGLGEPLDL